jgi:hypothetical protein
MDVLIPAGLVAFLALFIYALVRAGRGQRQMKRTAFREFARGRDLRYDAEDDGRARRFVRDMDGLGHTHSPSLGAVVPEDLVSGNVNGLAVLLFRHRTRFYEGYSREWFVAGVHVETRIAGRCSVEFLERKAAADSMYLGDPVLEERAAGPFRVRVRAPNRAAVGKILEGPVLEELSGLAGRLPFRPEIQLRGDRVAVYPADRNASIADVDDLEKLLAFSMTVARTA